MKLLVCFYLNISDESAIVACLVDPEYQRQGIGSQLLDSGIEERIKNRISMLKTQVIPGSASERMLQKRNFKKTDYRQQIEKRTGYRAHEEYILELGNL